MVLSWFEAMEGNVLVFLRVLLFVVGLLVQTSVHNAVVMKSGLLTSLHYKNISLF